MRSGLFVHEAGAAPHLRDLAKAEQLLLRRIAARPPFFQPPSFARRRESSPLAKCQLRSAAGILRRELGSRLSRMGVKLSKHGTASSSLPLVGREELAASPRLIL